MRVLKSRRWAWKEFEFGQVENALKQAFLAIQTDPMNHAEYRIEETFPNGDHTERYINTQELHSICNLDGKILYASLSAKKSSAATIATVWSGPTF